jgi:hypothetical protein
MVARPRKPGLGHELAALRQQLNAGSAVDSLDAFEKLFGLYLHVRRDEFTDQLDALQQRVESLERSLGCALARG